MKTTLFSAFVMTALFACNSNNNPNTPTPHADSTTVQTPQTTEPTVQGTVSAVEDAGYPMGFVEIMPDGGKEAFYLNFDLEGGPFKMEELMGFLNKKVKATYTERMEDLVGEIKLGDKSLNGEPEMQSHWTKLTGTLQATEVTAGDLPGTISLKLDDGSTRTYSIYVTEEMVAANGKKVDLWYMTAPERDLKSISAL